MPTDEQQLPLMERIGIRYFRNLSKRYPSNFSPDEIHVLNEDERAQLMRIQRNTIARAALAGAISAGLSVLAGVLFEPMLQGQVEDPPWELFLPYFGAVTGVTILVTVLEIAFLYWDSLRSVHRLAATAGLEMFPDAEENAEVASALVRAALELPNPPDSVDGINPRREISKWRVLVSTIVYKLKATATNFIIKALVRRVVGRSGFRAWMEITAVPVFAFWNGLIAWWVLRQARIRAIGPSAVTEFARIIFEDAHHASELAQEQAFRAIGAAIVRTVDLHPNLVALMRATEKALGDPGEVVLDDSELFLEKLPDMTDGEQDMVLKVLVLACIIDGKLARREKQLLKQAFEVAGYQPDLTGTTALRKAFVAGKPIEEAMITRTLMVR